MDLTLVPCLVEGIPVAMLFVLQGSGPKWYPTHSLTAYMYDGVSFFSFVVGCLSLGPTLGHDEEV